MSTFKALILQVRYPYTAGVLMTIWLGSALLLAISPDLAIKRLLLLNCLASVIVAILGFVTPRH